MIEELRNIRIEGVPPIVGGEGLLS